MPQETELTIDCDFPGGNIIVVGIEEDTVTLRPDTRDTEGWWFYWYFRVRGASERMVRFVFEGDNPIGVRGPAVSIDSGLTWAWLGKDCVEGSSFRYALPENADEVRFSFAMPYVESNLRTFAERFSDSPNFEADVLCKTRKGRDVEILHAGKLDGKCRYRVLLTCRHHSCEMMASYALEGIMDSIMADTDDGRWFREHVEFLIVPFMDKDGVEDGDQGKHRRPHDHNRDYSGESIYPAVQALRECAPKWSQGLLRMSMDIHCPWIRGGNNETVYSPGIDDPANEEQLRKFSAFLETAADGPIKYDPKNNLPFGQGWNTAKTFSQGKSCSKWFSEIPGNLLAATLELPYANASGAEVNADSARAFGQSIAKAIRLFLETRP